MRRRIGWLLDDRGNPEGGKWNYDADNRETFGKSGPPEIPSPLSFDFDATTQEVAACVDTEFADSPGRTRDFDYPLTRAQAQAAPQDFIEHRLADFGRHQDAMASGRPYLYHSRLPSALNLRLLDPREVIEQTLAAYRERGLPLNFIEGFVPQILGWREYVRGVYWQEMPDYEDRNALAARCLPSCGPADRDELSSAERRSAHRPRLCSPHPTTDGAGAVQPLARSAAEGRQPLASHRVHRRHRLGFPTQRHRH